MISTLEEANEYLEALIPPRYKTTQAMRLERIAHLLKLLGNPHKKLQFIHVGGTSGKGSVAHYLSQLLSGQGYKVGLHISPHLQTVRERMQINGQLISKEEFINLVNKVKPLVTQVENELGLGKPTYFETLVAISFKYFEDEKVDIAIVEVGLGGTLDATNIIRPLLSIITNISLDHTEILGKTIQKIAKDKAGIIKEGAPVITGTKQPSTQKIIKQKATASNSKLYFLGEDFDYKIKKIDLSGVSFNFSLLDKVSPCQLSTAADYQAENATLALATIYLLRDLGFRLDEKRLYASLRQIKIPGRFEIVQKKPLIILDGAHNPTKIKTLLASLTEIFPNKKFIFLIAFKKDKNIKAMLKELTPYSKAFVVTEFSKVTDMGKRFTAPAEAVGGMLKDLKFSGRVLVEKNSTKALGETKKLAGIRDAVIVTGSLYLVGETRDLFLRTDFR